MMYTYLPRILVIEDDQNVREVVIALLASFGYDCQTAADGRSGLVRLGEDAWDLVLTDLAMPEVSGWELVDAIRQQAPTVPIVVMTGLRDPAVLLRARDCRVRVIEKPFYVSTLKTALLEALSEKRASSTPPSWQGV
jgi:CheY-like chemotaxis protein